MARPVIGVTTYTPCDGESPAFSLPREYVDCLVASGADVVLLPVGDPQNLLARIDGLVLAGGGDLDPAAYDGSTHSTVYMVDPERDRFETALARNAIRQHIPLLAICRGLQIVNVAMGGTLVSHIPERCGDVVAHRMPPREPVRHLVRVDPRSRLARIVGDAPLEVVSWHHQAIDRLGGGVRATAWANDGVIEAVELDGCPSVLAVQWHPELNAKENRRQMALFRALVQAAGTGAAREARS